MKPNRSENLLHPIFRAIVGEGLKKARDAGLKVYIFEGWRSRSRQGWLFAQGRTRLGNIVTNSLPGYSMHQYGLAVDLVFDGSARPGIQWDWSGDYVGARINDYKRLGKIMESIAGITRIRNRAGKLIEMPHFQLDCKLTIQEIFKKSKEFGDLAVWDNIDALMLNGGRKQ